MRVGTIFLGMALILSLTNCASYDFSRRVVEQGNMLPQETVQRLKIGMSKSDAAILLGSSLLSPTFNNDRWDYAYTLRKGNGPLVVQNLTLYFSHGSLSRIERSPKIVTSN
ncbi:Outer membrane protein assembly factor BamE precursor [Legionella massiliensis]|uniref:Outer membrane protein assembly factor BamE n=2 Tax=Legionella massiliensis TaxID=1034943 RepID=A0A078KUA9_9GAMM|nr:Outer membrane protein assembly factor BamE precursor [Legionella massiliensis]CEE13773.1 Outer membrane protein assembly factor BamE precursor [Legionella massiliensis]